MILLFFFLLYFVYEAWLPTIIFCVNNSYFSTKKGIYIFLPPPEPEPCSVTLFNFSQVQEARAAAQKAQQLLQNVANRKRQKQLETNGLVVVKAVYGNHKALMSRHKSEETEVEVSSQIMDVTIPLNFLVNDSGQLKVSFYYKYLLVYILHVNHKRLDDDLLFNVKWLWNFVRASRELALRDKFGLIGRRPDILNELVSLWTIHK